MLTRNALKSFQKNQIVLKAMGLLYESNKEIKNLNVKMKEKHLAFLKKEKKKGTNKSKDLSFWNAFKDYAKIVYGRDLMNIIEEELSCDNDKQRQQAEDLINKYLIQSIENTLSENTSENTNVVKADSKKIKSTVKTVSSKKAESVNTDKALKNNKKLDKVLTKKESAKNLDSDLNKCNTKDSINSSTLKCPPSTDNTIVAKLDNPFIEVIRKDGHKQMSLASSILNKACGSNENSFINKKRTKRKKKDKDLSLEPRLDIEGNSLESSSQMDFSMCLM